MTTSPESVLLPENAPELTLPERIEARWGRERWHDSEGLPRQRAQRAMIAASAGRITYEDFENQLLRERLADSEIACIRAQAPKGPAVHSGSRQTSADVLQAALLCHLGHEATAVKALGAPAAEAGRGMRITHALDLVKACLDASGMAIPAARDDMIRASGFSTVSLPGILGNVANKLLLDAYQAVPSVARIVAKKLTASDFKQHTGYRLSAESKFEEVGAAGELKHGSLGESSFAFKIATFARMFNLTRQSLINDDLGAFEAMPRLCGRGAAVALEEKFWQLVLANTGTFFGSGNANYISGAGTALDISSLGAAVTKMRQAVDANGVPVLLTPKYLVVPPELEATADALYASTNIVLAGDTDAVSPDGNPYKNKYQPLVVPHLSNASYTNYSTTGWYLFGLPDDVAAFGIAFLNNQESPTIESSDSDFNTLGTQFRGYLDFGVCQIDHRGAVMSAGA